MRCFGQRHTGGLRQSYRLKPLPCSCQPNDLITTPPLVNLGKPILPPCFEGFHQMNTEGKKLILTKPSDAAGMAGQTTLGPSAASVDVPAVAAPTWPKQLSVRKAGWAEGHNPAVGSAVSLWCSLQPRSSARRTSGMPPSLLLLGITGVRGDKPQCRGQEVIYAWGREAAVV